MFWFAIAVIACAALAMLNGWRVTKPEEKVLAQNFEKIATWLGLGLAIWVVVAH